LVQNLTGVQDVAKLDVSKYNVELLGTLVEHPDWLCGLSQITGKISLQSETSKIDVLFKFRNNSLSWCLVRVIDGSPLYTESQSTDLRDLASDFLQRYQAYSGDSDLETMRNMLDIVDVAENTTKTVGNVKVEVSVMSFSSSFAWMNTFNGAEYSGICVDFKDGNFYSFSDDRSYYKIGGTYVNIDKEDAINIALKEVEDFSWTVDSKEVTDFGIVKEYINAELLTRSKEPLELYPYWLVSLPLDDVYPVNVNSIIVAIWADTSEIIEVYPLGFGGELTATQDLSSSTLEQQLTDKTSSIDMSMAVVVATIIMLIATFAIVVKKRRK
jgi:hypothetical protein